MRSLLVWRSWSTIMILPSSGNSISWGHWASWGHWPFWAPTSSPKGDLVTFQYLVWVKPLHLRTGFEDRRIYYHSFLNPFFQRKKPNLCYLPHTTVPSANPPSWLSLISGAQLWNLEISPLLNISRLKPTSSTRTLSSHMQHHIGENEEEKITYLSMFLNCEEWHSVWC